MPGNGPMLDAQELGEAGIDETARRRPKQQRDALQDAQHGDRGDHRIDTGIANHPAIDRPDGKPGEQAADKPQRQLRRPDAGCDNEGSEHDGEAHHRADRNVETAHQQHVELRYGDQRQGGGRQQDVAKVDRGQEDIRLCAPRKRRPRPSARPGSPSGIHHLLLPAASVSKTRCSSVGGSARASAVKPSLAIRNDETMLSSVTSAPVSSRMMRPRENTSTRSQMPASSSASDELTTQPLPSAALARMAR